MQNVASPLAKFQCSINSDEIRKYSSASHYLFIPCRWPNVASSLVKCNKWVWGSATPRCCTSCPKASGGEGYKSGNKGSAAQNREISERKNGPKIQLQQMQKYQRTRSRLQILLYDANLEKAFPRCTVVAAPCNSQTRMAQLSPSLKKKNKIFTAFEVCFCTLHHL